ncbi:MAG: helix-turn-helix domain-containing protein [Ignavibacteriales bacterium]
MLSLCWLLSASHEETTLREIAAKARTSESQIIKYFQSKAGILDALFSRTRAYLDEPLKRLCEETEDPSLVLEKGETRK